MKRSFKLASIILSIFILLGVLAGCSAKSQYSVNNHSGSAPSAPMPEEAPAEDSKFTNHGLGSGGSLEPEKVITTMHLYFESTEFDKSNEELAKLIEKYKAYIEYSNISYNRYYNSKNYRYGEFVIRVPKANITSFKTELGAIGNLTSENTSKQDVTKQYQDTESRLKVVEIKEERLLSLLEKAEKIEDIIAIENQLSEVIYEKESLKSSLMTLDDKVDYTTVNLNIEEVDKASSTETVETTFGTRIINAMRNSLYSFRVSMENLTISLIYMIPFLIILAIIAYIAVRLAKKYRKNNQNKL